MGSIAKKALNLIKGFEGFHQYLYLCPGGYKTVGYGHVVKPNELARFKGRSITEGEAEALLLQDIGLAETAVLRLINTQLNANQIVALLSFTFNLGSGALQRSTLRQVVNRGEHDSVPQELMRWIYAGNRKLNGLIRRRRIEAELYAGKIVL